MKKIKIFLVLLVLFISISAVSAEGNFTTLQEEINSSIDSIDITQDYTYDNTTDYNLKNGILINKTDFTVNGNGFTINGANQSRLFLIIGNNITILNLNLINGYSNIGPAIVSESPIIINNVSFANNHATMNGGAVYVENTTEILNCHFENNTAIFGGNIYSTKELYVTNSTFTDSTSKYAPAIYGKMYLCTENCIFENLHAEESAGAIGLKDIAYSEINNCTFINTSSRKNGGAVFMDIGDINGGGLSIYNSRFFNSTGDYGGAVVQLGGNLDINYCEFYDNTAIYSGGAIYISNVFAIINNTHIYRNKLDYDEFYGGGLYTDYSETYIENCEFINNTRQGIYAYDKYLSVTNTTFSNNGEAIHAVFAEYDLNDIIIENDTLFLNDTCYESCFKEIGKSIILIENSINVATLPSRYDSREWGWVSSVKNQGDMGSCWTFGTCGALESALLKATGIEYDFSENNMQNSMLEYSKYGIIGATEGGSRDQGLQYILSWFGVMPTEYDTYDELGKLSPAITGDDKIHIFDALFVDSRANATDNDALKRAILRCGSVTTGYFHSNNGCNETSGAYYQYEKNSTNHAISLVGWDDNYPASNFNTPAPGNGAFILKNSWGTGVGDNGFLYISYYDTSLLNTTFAIGFIIENTENYTTNYQTDLGGGTYLMTNNGSIMSFKNTYESYGNELISAVGTYFNEDEDYVLEIYVNGELAHTQNGTSPFNGFHTVKLTTEIPVTFGDNFTALMKKTSARILLKSRQHYLENVSFINLGAGWSDLAEDNATVSLKVYTKDLAIYTQDLVKIYKNDAKFEANIGEANETVSFEINGMTYNRTSDEKGIARMAINLLPGNYTIKTSYNNVSVENNIEILPTLIATNLVKYFRNDSQFFIDLIDGEGNPVNNTEIRMNINGVFYTRETNENGTARLNINLNPGEYILTALDPLTGLEMAYNITVLPTLTADDIEMTYLDGTQFKAKIVDGTGKAIANVEVKFNVNGVFYYRTTDSEGIARLNINLISGQYIITSQYEDAVISNKITIKG